MHKCSKFTLLCPGHVKICEKYGVHMSLLSYFIGLELINEILSLMVSVHFYCLFQSLCLLLCTHSLLHPWLSTEGSGTWTGGPALHPLWSEGVRRIGCVVCCAETWGGFAGLGYYSPAPHSSRASRLPTVQHCISPSCSLCQLSGWMYCGPAEKISWSVW